MRRLFQSRLHLLLLLMQTAALPVAFAAPYSAEVLADNPVAFYRFNEDPDATVAFDSSPNGNHASYAGTTTPTIRGKSSKILG
ncbi:hypothetical protein N9195_01685 [bacterium]|nr:hypothetical protein [bacterium]